MRRLVILAAVLAAIPLLLGASYWASLNTEVVSGNQENLSMTFTSGGSAVDITSWTLSYKATAAWTDSVITVPNDSITKSDSGSGTTDTATIPLSEYQTSRMPAGRYNHEIVAVISGNTRTLFRGTLRIYERIASP